MTTCIGLVFDRLRWEEKQILDAARVRGVELRTIDAKEIHLDIEAKRENLEEQLGSIILQRCMGYFRGLHIAAYADSVGIPTVNDFKVQMVCGNKFLTTLSLTKVGIPTPRTLVSFSPESALQSMEEVGYPNVLKPVVGSWGRMISLINDREVGKSILEMRTMLNNPLNQIYYVQEMVKRPPRDIRTIVIGDEVVASTYRNAAEGEWRTNVARGGEAEPMKITDEQEELVLKAARAVGGGVLGVDAMESSEGLVIHEVNSTVEFRGAYGATRADIAGKILDHALSQLKG